METTIDGRDGWIAITHAGVHVLTKGDDDLRERLLAALGAAGDDTLADVVTDELTTGGVRRTPDFAILDEAGGRILVRGSAAVRLTGPDGTTREVLASARGPWADEDLDEGVESVVLTTGVLEPEHEPEDVPPARQSAPGGWAVPSVFGGAAPQPEPSRPALSVVSEEPVSEEPAAGHEPATPVEESAVIETPAPEGQDIAADEPRPAATGQEDDADDELPSFDFLFGNTSHHRSSLLSGLEEEESGEGAESIDSGPVAAAGGYQAKEDPTNATLAPPAEDDERHEGSGAAQSGPPISSVPGGVPPMPGGASPAPDAAAESSVAPAGVQAARDDAPGGEPAAGRPQFADGHLVGSRVSEGASSDSAAPAGASAPAAPLAQDGMISSVPWAQGATDQAASDGAGPYPGTPGGVPGLPVGLPGVPTPDHGPAQPTEPAPDFGSAPSAGPTYGGPQPAQEAAVDTGELPSGPMVLAVRCSSGHHNAPHATRCRVCGQDLPSQQPEQTPRPALGLLRLSTGDVVTLDRGVLLGRAPRASAEASGARTPHLVRIASPDNEISRNHVEIVLDGWHVLVRDLGSTNGTTVALPGSSPVRVRPGDQQTIEPGTTITLADQVSMVFEVTG